MHSMMKKLFVILCMSFAVYAFTQSAEEQLFDLPPVDAQLSENLYSELFVVFIRITLQRPNGETPWQRHDIHYTLNNTQLSLNFVNSDAVAIQINVTPQKRTKDSLLILVSWQLWFKTYANSVQYMNAANFYTIKPGERIIFYPFGTKKDHQPIIIEILVDTYEHAHEQGGIKVRKLFY